MLIGAHKIQRWLWLWLFLEQYRKDGNEFLNHIVHVTGDETWVSSANAETKEQSKQWMRTHSPNMPKKFTIRCLPERWWQLFSVTGKEC
jgi:hypothetical protein